MTEDNLIPFISMEEMIEVDRLMVDHFGIQLIQMMENAGRHLASLARDRFLNSDAWNKKITVLAGSGGNGGGAMVAARTLQIWGAKVEVYLTQPPKELKGTVRHQAEILSKQGLNLDFTDLPLSSYQPDLIIDGIIGYSLKGPPRSRAAELIVWANSQASSVLALDLPSGLHANTGEVYDPAIKADATMTLALPKVGLKNPSKPVVGELYLADIGVPPTLFSLPPLNLKVGAIFSEQSVLRLD
jgi:NAD(P)H-hydrate epimerase